MLVRIISGGEPGAEQAALDAALEAGVVHGGWIPMGRPTEAGPLPDEFLLTELSSTDLETAAARVLSIWLRMHSISVLHVTGPRASEEFRTYARVRAVMSLLLGSHGSDHSPVLRTAALRSGPGC